jgi:hypothetical protein
MHKFGGCSFMSWFGGCPIPPESQKFKDEKAAKQLLEYY